MSDKSPTHLDLGSASFTRSTLSYSLVSKGWLSLSGLQKLEQLAQGDVDQMIKIITTLRADLCETLMISMSESLSLIKTSDVMDITLSLSEEGQAKLDRYIEALFTQSVHRLDGSEIIYDATLDAEGMSAVTEEPCQHPQGSLLEGRYQVADRLGEGGMCYVDRAYDKRLGREVALKRLKPALSDSEEAYTLFEIEARIMGRLAHPNILPVYDLLLTEPGRSSGYTMRVIPYPNLYEAYQQGPLPSHHQLCQILRQAALALESAHGQGVVHRDVKPHNILIGSEGEVYMSDWGICTLSERHPDAHLISNQSAKALVGTPSFMSPEQVKCDAQLISPLTDVYGLGATLYFTLTGRPPFQGEGLVELLKHISQTAPLPPSVIAQRAGLAKVPRALEQICLKAISKRPQDRYQSARAFAQALESYLTGETERERKLLALQEALARGHSARERYHTLKSARAKLQEGIEELIRSDELFSADNIIELQQKRAARWALEEQLDDLIGPLEESFAQASAEYQSALSIFDEVETFESTSAQEARISLSELLWARYLEAESRGDVKEVAHLEGRLRLLGTEEVIAQLDGYSSLELRGLPDGATIEICRESLLRYHVKSERVASLTSPLEAPLRLIPSVYHVKISHPQVAPCALHIKLGRGRSMTLTPQLLRADQLPPHSVYIPDPQGKGGVVYMKHLVRYREYVAFLNQLQSEPEARAPRYGGTLYVERGVDGRFVDDFIDAEGDRWSPDWPIMLVNAFDIKAYAEWRAQQDGVPWRLPTVEEWKLAAQGSDERPYPWGLQFDSALCLMRESMRGRVTPSPVGSIETDQSPYGLYDVAGNVCQWTSSKVEGEEDIYRVVGSSFNSVAATCHLNTELSSPPGECLMHIGARLVFTVRSDQLFVPT